MMKERFAYRLDYETAQHICQIVEEYFAQIAEEAEGDHDIDNFSFTEFARDFWPSGAEMEALKEISPQVEELLQKIVSLTK